MKTFISFSTRDQVAADAFVEELRLHYISDFFFSSRTMEHGYWLSQIEKEIRQARTFIVLISPQSAQSNWVREEVRLAMETPKLKGRVIPVFLEPTEHWTQLHPSLGRIQSFDVHSDRQDAMTHIIERVFNRPRHTHPPFRIGDAMVQILLLAGGNGVTRYCDGDIRCEGPGKDTQQSKFQLAPDIAIGHAERMCKKTADAKERDKMFFNSPQVRLANYGVGGPNQSGGITDTPLRLKLGWTEYFHTTDTNISRTRELACGQSIELKYGKDLYEFANSRLSNPIATNMSVVTSDNKIFLSTRGEKVAYNPGEFQPAVSGDGQPEDLRDDGTYDPFMTAMREAKEECIGRFPVTRDMVTFFGLARTRGTQFPFLFGEIRLPIPSTEVPPPLNVFEGNPFPIDFTIPAVCDWVQKYHLDHYHGRRGGVIGTTLFSLLQSLIYEFPDSYSEIASQLRIKSSTSPQQTNSDEVIA